jgi:hypothetical protein
MNKRTLLRIRPHSNEGFAEEALGQQLTSAEPSPVVAEVA